MLKKLLEYEKQYKKAITKDYGFEKQLEYVTNKLKINNQTKKTLEC